MLHIRPKKLRKSWEKKGQIIDMIFRQVHVHDLRWNWMSQNPETMLMIAPCSLTCMIRQQWQDHPSFPTRLAQTRQCNNNICPLIPYTPVQSMHVFRSSTAHDIN